MHAIRAILILLLALHPAMVLGARSAPLSDRTQPGCSCCDDAVCSCGCCETGACICATPDPLTDPLPTPASAPGASQVKPIAGLPAGVRPRLTEMESDSPNIRADRAWRQVRGALTSCDSAQALLCIWTT